MRFLVTFVCLAVMAACVMAQSVEEEAISQALVDPNAVAAALLAADSDTGHQNESERFARQNGRRGGGYRDRYYDRYRDRYHYRPRNRYY